MNLNLNISDETFEQIERYLLQQMPAVEKQVFEEQLQTNAQLQDCVQQVQLLITGVQEASLTTRLNSFHQDMPVAQLQPLKIRKVVPLKRWLVAASIFFLLGLGAWWLLSGQSKNEKLYAAYFRPDPGLVTAMSSSDNYIFDKAMVDYKTGNYPKAIEAWKGLLNTNATNDTLNYFVGSALLANKKSIGSNYLFTKSNRREEQLFLQDAYWYLGLLYIQMNRPKEAIPFIQKSGRPEAAALLEQLRK